MTRPAALALVLAGALLQGGCAAACPAARPPRRNRPPRLSALAVEVVAPAGLKEVLERHLDLIRLAQASRGEAVTDEELGRLVDAAEGQVRELASTEGYFDARSQLRRAPRAAAGRTGDRARHRRAGRARARGAHDAGGAGGAGRGGAGDEQALQLQQAWRAAWRLKPGAVFRNADWADAKSAAMSWLRSRGYAAAAWAGTAVEIHLATRTARVFAVAHAAGFRRGPVVAEGLSRHDLRTAENLGHPGGQRGDGDAAAGRTGPAAEVGLFERVAVLLDTDPVQADAARIFVTVSEASLHQLTLGAGFSANTGGRLTAEHIYRRVMGYAATARNKVELAQARQAWDGELSTHADERLNRWVLGGTTERLSGASDVVLSQRLKFGRAQDSRIDRFNFGEFDRSTRRADGLRTDSTPTR
jgi:translocation and assembly module TamA